MISKKLNLLHAKDGSLPDTGFYFYHVPIYNTMISKKLDLGHAKDGSLPDTGFYFF